MSRRDEYLGDVQCHCGGDDGGHPLAAEQCTATVKAGTSWHAPNSLAEPWQVGGLYAALADAARTPAERERWRGHARMLRDAHRAVRRRSRRAGA